jgi:hypothetical protein
MPTLLNFADDRYCSDAKDKVFGMLSLAAEDVRVKFNVSYDVLEESIFLQATKSALEEETGIDYLSLKKGRPRCEKLPTWCVEFHEPKVNDQFSFTFQGLIEEGSWPQRQGKASVSLDTGYLKLFAYEVDRIELGVQAPSKKNTGSLYCRE